MKKTKSVLFIGLFIFLLTGFTSQIISQNSDAVKLYNSGVKSEQAKSYDEALIYYTMALDMEPNYKAALTNRANIYKVLKIYGKSISDYTRLIQLDNKNAAYFLNRAGVYTELKDYKNIILDCS